MKREAFEPWYKRSETYLQVILILIIIGVFYIFLIGELKGWQGIWVLVNVLGGYLILSNLKQRKRIRKVWKGVLVPGVWAVVLLLLFLIAVSSAMMMVFSGGGGGSVSSGSGSGNPFVSNILLVVVMFPIIPLFADAETHLFQRYILQLFIKDSFVECPHCKKLTPPGVPCYECDKDVPGEKLHGTQVWIAIVVSAILFAAAHMLLLMSVFPVILTIGGAVLGWLFVKKGHLYTAWAHLVYDLILLVLVFIIMVSFDGGNIV